MRQGDDIEHPNSTPDRGLAVLERIPGETDTRREVLECRVVIVGFANRHLRVGDVAKIPKLSIHFLDHGGHVIPHTKIEGEVRPDAEVVLNISPENRVPQAADAICACKLRAELSWLDLQHGSDRGEGPKPVGTISFIQVIQNPFEREAGTNAVAAFGPGQIVIKLRSGVKEFVQSALADAAEPVPEPGGVNGPDGYAWNEAERRIIQQRELHAAVELVARPGAGDSDATVVDQSGGEYVLQTQNHVLSATERAREFLVIGRGRSRR